MTKAVSGKTGLTPLQRLEIAAVRAVMRLMRALGPVQASNLGGWLARTTGPLMPVSDVVRRNLAHAMPQLDPGARRRVLLACWDNLGRTVAELPFVATLGPTAAGPGWEIKGLENLAPLLPGAGPAIVLTGHIANWEVVLAALRDRGVRLAAFYRPSPNPAINELVAELRDRPVMGGHGADANAGSAPMFAKGASGARGALGFLRGGGVIGILADQKMNDGVQATLFGQPAMTASALASLALRFGCPVIPVHTERLGPARMRVVIDPPLVQPQTADRNDGVLAITQAANDRLEQWITARPGEWLWMHRRWPKPLYIR